ncbi:hypothetical protein ACQKP1_09795 [Allorhizobium sp. NPDC080224]|uniref:hypothetical protein n=1 Tax=Allorhizobium sp. NPDC080224 TaxID=3390547 RepID=UPI003CFE7973
MRGDGKGLQAEDERAPLISTRFLIIATSTILILAAASIAISWFGRAYGARLSLAGHSESTEIVDITIGRDRLAFPANTIRFEHQRRSGVAERVDLYLLWPEMTGYSSVERRRFDDLPLSQSLVFLQISQSTMSKDMSGRVEPIYTSLLEPEIAEGPAGLQSQVFRVGTGYEGESLLTATAPDGTTYAIRCLLPLAADKATSSDCQRDIHVGEDLTVLYRFSSRMLDDWQAIDEAVRAYVSGRAGPAAATTTLKNQSKTSTDRSS